MIIKYRVLAYLLMILSCYSMKAMDSSDFEVSFLDPTMNHQSGVLERNLCDMIKGNTIDSLEKDEQRDTAAFERFLQKLKDYLGECEQK